MKSATLQKEETKDGGSLTQRKEHPLFDSLQQEMNRLFDEFRRGFGLGPQRWFEPLSEFHAKIDVKDTEEEVVVTAELPGVDLKDIDISLVKGALSIKGEKRVEKEEKEKGYYRMERSYGSFHRLIPMPTEIDQENIKATYKDGVVKVNLPKIKEAITNERKIAVNAG